VYTSPFLHAVETAEEICREIGREAVLEPGLGEHRNAEWFDEEPETVAPARLAEWFDPISLDYEPYRHPTFPESHAEATMRIGDTARHLADTTPGTVLLVGHGATVGGVVQGLVGSVDGVDAPLCGLTRIDRDDEDGGWRLAFSGDTSHL
jgi:broad specificity phosphatase PhoE